MLPPHGSGTVGTLPWSCLISIPAPGLTGVPAPEPPPRTQLSHNGAWHCTEDTSAFGAGLPQTLLSQVPKGPSLAPCVSKILPGYPSIGLHSTRSAHSSSHGLGTTAHTPLNPAHCRLVRSPPKQLLQPHLLLSAHGKDTPGTGKTLWDLEPGECCSAGGSQPSREKLQCHFWVMGINNHWGTSCATHKSLLNLTFIPTLLWKLKAIFSLCFGRKMKKSRSHRLSTPRTCL